MQGALVIVNFNQSIELPDVLTRVKKHCSNLKVIVVDDGSTDGSNDIAKEEGYEVIEHGTNQGVGAAIRSGIKYVLGFPEIDFVIILSANGKMQPEEYTNVAEPILSGQADYVQGSRFAGSQKLRPGLPWFRWLSIRLFSYLSSLLLGNVFTDITCGYRAYTTAFLRRSEINLDQNWLNRYELEYYLHYWACYLKVRMQEVPVTISYKHLSRTRRSHIRPILDWWSIVRPFFLLKLGIRS